MHLVDRTCKRSHLKTYEMFEKLASRHKKFQNGN